jgi:hypothetical protein
MISYLAHNIHFYNLFKQEKLCWSYHRSYRAHLVNGLVDLPTSSGLVIPGPNMVYHIEYKQCIMLCSSSIDVVVKILNSIPCENITAHFLRKN